MGFALLIASLEPQLEPGWPSPPFNLSYFLYPTFCGGEGVVSVIYRTTTDGLGFWALDGQPPQGWPKIWPMYGKGFLNNLYPIGDVDADGKFELFTIRDTFWVLVEIPSGETTRVKREWESCFYYWSPPAMYDADRDGAPEVYWFEARDADTLLLGEYRLYRFDGTRVDSAVLRFNPLDSAGVSAHWVRLAVGDFLGDGRARLAFMAPGPDSSHPAELVLVDAENLEIYKEIPLPGLLKRFPVIADLDGDGSSEALVSVGLKGDSAAVYIVNLKNDTFSLFREFGPGESSFPTLGDVDGDGLPELVEVRLSQGKQPAQSFTEKIDTATLLLRAYEADGAVIYEDSIRFWGNRELFPLTGDLDGDGTDDLLLSAPLLEPDSQAISAYSFSKGVLWQVHIPPDTSFQNLTPYINNAVFPFLADIDGDSRPEFAAGRVYYNNQDFIGLALLSLWEIPVENPHLGWPMLYHDPWNTNNYDFWPPQVGVRESASGRTPKFLKPTPEGLLVNSPKAQLAELKVYDVAGRLVYKGKVNLKAGANLIKVPGKGVRVVSLLGEKVKLVSPR